MLKQQLIMSLSCGKVRTDDVAFVSFHLSVHDNGTALSDIFRHPVFHEPSGLLGNFQATRQLIGRNTVGRDAIFINGAEPYFQSQLASFKNRTLLDCKSATVVQVAIIPELAFDADDICISVYWRS